ncbi:DJ-1/PfpI family protein [Streptomyces sp. TRM70308]|uniref:DJ-1/PfpI family protein n=1 Tax=Streptomyces sp. TRM70308 TaxID=3131932 RepID=UPI003D01ABD6
MKRRDVIRTSAGIGITGAALGGLGTASATAREQPPNAPRGPLRVHVVLFDGAEELDFAAPYDVLSAAGFFTDRAVDVRYVGVTGPGVVEAAYGTRIRVPHGWAPHRADVLLVPGGGYTRRDGPGVWAEIERGTLPRALAAAARPGLTLASVCTGAILLSAAGLTRGRPCTTHHRTRPYLEEQGGVLKNARVVDDGDLVTAGGVTSGLDLALWLARRELGPDAALGLEAMLEYEARGTVWAPPHPTDHN